MSRNGAFLSHISLLACLIDQQQRRAVSAKKLPAPYTPLKGGAKPAHDLYNWWKYGVTIHDAEQELTIQLRGRLSSVIGQRPITLYKR
ncbi:MAG: hypothetical protein NPIRA01_32770 [Nitrospirales bacterium]|nr:MAG: hypothetical protein NPIRA01_32770 [Nitrospirales bacterium]